MKEIDFIISKKHQGACQCLDCGYPFVLNFKDFPVNEEIKLICPNCQSNQVDVREGRVREKNPKYKDDSMAMITIHYSENVKWNEQEMIDRYKKTNDRVFEEVVKGWGLDDETTNRLLHREP